MPFKSEKQRKYMWANKPEIAREFEEKTPKGKKLPTKVKKTKDKEKEAMYPNLRKLININ
jgi:hypothetical protein